MWWWQQLQDVQSSSQIVTTNKPTPNFLQPGRPSWRPTNSVKALKGRDITRKRLTSKILASQTSCICLSRPPISPYCSVGRSSTSIAFTRESYLPATTAQYSTDWIMDSGIADWCMWTTVTSSVSACQHSTHWTHCTVAPQCFPTLSVLEMPSMHQ